MTDHLKSASQGVEGRPLTPDFSKWYPEAAAIVKKYAPGEEGLVNHLARRFSEIEVAADAAREALRVERDEVISELMASLEDKPGKNGFVHLLYCNNGQKDTMPGTRGVTCNCHPTLRHIIGKLEAEVARLRAALDAMTRERDLAKRDVEIIQRLYDGVREVEDVLFGIKDRPVGKPPTIARWLNERRLKAEAEAASLRAELSALSGEEPGR